MYVSQGELGRVLNWMVLWIRNASPPPLSLFLSLRTSVKSAVFGSFDLLVSLVS